MGQRILYIHQYFRTPEMAGGTRSYEFARRLVHAGHNVQMITADTEGLHGTKRKWTQTREDGIHVHWLRLRYSNKLGYGKRMLSFARFAVAAAGKARRLGGDVVFATSTPLTVALPGVYASQMLRIPMVFEVRDLWPELPIALEALRNPLLIGIAKRLERFAYAHAARIIALSPGMRDGVVRTGFPADRIAVIPNASDTKLFSCSRDEGRSFLEQYISELPSRIVTYAGTLGLANGVGYLVKVAEIMRLLNPCVGFLIVGDGRERELIHGAAKKAGVLDRSLWMIPRVSKRDMPKVLAGSDIATSFVIDVPVMWNNSANKFFDTLAAGRPMAINHQGWQAELLERSGAGIVLPPNDARTAAEILARFLSSNERLEIASIAARQLAEQEFDRDLLFRRFHDVILEAAGRGIAVKSR